MSRCFCGSIRVKVLKRAQIAFELFFQGGMFRRFRKADFDYDLPVTEAIWVMDLPDKVKNPFLFRQICIDGYLSNIHKLCRINRFDVHLRKCVQF